MENHGISAMVSRKDSMEETKAAQFIPPDATPKKGGITFDLIGRVDADPEDIPQMEQVIFKTIGFGFVPDHFAQIEPGNFVAGDPLSNGPRLDASC